MRGGNLYYEQALQEIQDGMPASAGGMCGPLFSQIVDGLLLP